jgi:hypothetical protein
MPFFTSLSITLHKEKASFLTLIMNIDFSPRFYKAQDKEK